MKHFRILLPLLILALVLSGCGSTSREPYDLTYKEWMTWGDSYELDIVNPSDEIVALAVVLTIDCVQEMQQNNN